MAQKGKHICSDIHVRECVDFEASHLLGAPFPVTLTGGVGQKFCQKCGATKGHIIKEPLQLIAMVSVLRACDDMKLNGSEAKFLRKSISFKAKHFAEALDLDPSHLSRMENDKVPMSALYEKMLRASVCLHYADAAKLMGVDVSHVVKMEITSAKCVTKSFALDLRLMEVEKSLRLVGSEKTVRTKQVRSWEDDCGPKLAS